MVIESEQRGWSLVASLRGSDDNWELRLYSLS